ncbi:MAG: hypothetical protein LZF60_370021 [Nitrospira sp.]|nr:MAG: hypothetical protein LZF60_370021 [Nitrospira sp.]
MFLPGSFARLNSRTSSLMTFRHTSVSLLLSGGVPFVYVAQPLGHAKPTTALKHYGQVDAERKPALCRCARS